MSDLRFPMKHLTLCLLILSACNPGQSDNRSDTVGEAGVRRALAGVAAFASLQLPCDSTHYGVIRTPLDSIGVYAQTKNASGYVKRSYAKIDSIERARLLCSPPPPSDSLPPQPVDTTPTQPPPPVPQPPPSGPLPVVPGLYGFGTATPAGRGGTVCRVTNLSDAGTGSLRACLALSGARVIVFETSGTISLTSKLTVSSPYLTVAGQTAPAPGILVRNYGISIRTHDVLVQHLRFRPGDSQSAGNIDGVEILGPSYNVVVDHTSASWATDEVMSTWYNGVRAHDVTVANSILAEGIRAAESGLGLLVGDSTKNFLVVGSLFVSNQERNPYFKGGTSGASVNNLVYNWGGNQAAYTQDDYNSGPALMSVVGNQFIRGPSTQGGRPIQIYSGVKAGTKVYVADNSDGRGAVPPADPWSLVYNQKDATVVASTPPAWPQGFTAQPNATVYNAVLANAGAWPAARDAVDARLVSQVKNGTGAIPGSVAAVGGFPTLAVNTRVLTPPANPNGIGATGYTILEEWLHALARTAEGR